MDDKIEDDARRAKGSLKEAIGMLIGDTEVEAQGAAEKATGQAQIDRKANRSRTRAPKNN